MIYAGYELVPDVPDKNEEPRSVIVFRLLPLESVEEMRESKTGGINSSGKEIPENWYWAESMDTLRKAAMEAPIQSRDATRASRNVYHRSETVRVYVLRRSNGVCEGCGNPAPFKTKEMRPYLEPHHTRRLSDDGPDHPEWVVAVCPTCHRRAHHAHDSEEYNEFLKKRASILEKEM
jgi:5-methylcytosine-specific restriction protein A